MCAWVCVCACGYFKNFVSETLSWNLRTVCCLFLTMKTGGDEKSKWKACECHFDGVVTVDVVWFGLLVFHYWRRSQVTTDCVFVCERAWVWVCCVCVCVCSILSTVSIVCEIWILFCFAGFINHYNLKKLGGHFKFLQLFSDMHNFNNWWFESRKNCVVKPLWFCCSCLFLFKISLVFVYLF